MGDQCVTIAKLTKLSSHLDTKQTVIESLVDMGERCEEMVKVSLDAFAARDVEQARGLHELDELVDRANRQVFARGARVRQRSRGARVGHAPDHRRALLRADRRQRRRHRRADRVPRDRRVRRVHRRIALSRASAPVHHFATGTFTPRRPTPSCRREHRVGRGNSTRGDGNTMRIRLGRRGVAVAAGAARGDASSRRRRSRGRRQDPTYNLKKLKGSITADGSSTVGPYTTAAAELFRKAGASGVQRHRRHLGHRRRLPALLQGRDRPLRRLAADEEQRSARPARTTTSARGARFTSPTTR